MAYKTGASTPMSFGRRSRPAQIEDAKRAKLLQRQKDQIVRSLTIAGDGGRNVAELAIRLDWPGGTIGISSILRQCIEDGDAIKSEGRYYISTANIEADMGKKTTPASKGPTRVDQVVEIVARDPGCSHNVIATGLVVCGVKSHNTSKIISNAKSQGAITTTGKKKGYRYWPEGYKAVAPIVRHQVSTKSAPSQKPPNKPRVKAKPAVLASRAAKARVGTRQDQLIELLKDGGLSHVEIIERMGVTDGNARHIVKMAIKRGLVESVRSEAKARYRLVGDTSEASVTINIELPKKFAQVGEPIEIVAMTAQELDEYASREALHHGVAIHEFKTEAERDIEKIVDLLRACPGQATPQLAKQLRRSIPIRNLLKTARELGLIVTSGDTHYLPHPAKLVEPEKAEEFVQGLVVTDLPSPTAGSVMIGEDLDPAPAVYTPGPEADIRPEYIRTANPFPPDPPTFDSLTIESLRHNVQDTEKELADLERRIGGTLTRCGVPDRVGLAWRLGWLEGMVEALKGAK